jgi:hexosaminidase
MSPTSHCYFDYAQAQGPREPECIGGFIPLSTVYEFEPVPPSLPESGRKHILGAQGNVWGEFLRNPRDVEYFTFPRAIALAEVVWSPASDRNYNEFLDRLKAHLRRLDVLNVHYRRLDGRSSK